MGLPNIAVTTLTNVGRRVFKRKFRRNAAGRSQRAARHNRDQCYKLPNSEALAAVHGGVVRSNETTTECGLALQNRERLRQDGPGNARVCQ